MPTDPNINAELEQIARKLEEQAGLATPAQSSDTEVVAKLRRIRDALDDFVGSIETHALPDHTDVDGATLPVAGQYLRGTGTEWVNSAIILTDLPVINLGDLGDVTDSGAADGETIRADGAGNWLNSKLELDDLSDVTVPTPSSGEVLQYKFLQGWVNDYLTLSSQHFTDVGFIPGTPDSLMITNASAHSNTVGYGASDLLLRDGSRTLTANWDAGAFDIEARAFEVKATANHRIDDDGSDNLVISNPNSDGDIICQINDGGTTHDFVTIDASSPSIVIEPTGGAAVLAGAGIIDVAGSWSKASVYGVLSFRPTFTGGVPIAFRVNPDYNFVSIAGELIRFDPTISPGKAVGANGIWGLNMAPGNVGAGLGQTFGLAKESFTRSKTTAGTYNYTGLKLGGIAIAQNAGAAIVDTMLDLNGGGLAILGGAVTQYGLKLTGFATATGATVYGIYSNGGTIALAADNAQIRLGAGEDVGMYYDGTDFNLDTDLVAASDFVLDCGTDKTLELEETVWDDVTVPISNLRLGGANPASEQSYKSGLVASFSSTSDNYIYFVIQLPHRYKEGTDLNLHIHWTIPTSGAGGGAENVKWDVTYSASSPVTGSFPAASTGTVTVDVQNDTADDHLVDSVATISGAAFGISEVLICSLKRDISVANDYAAAAYLVSVDAHFEVDTMGSRQEFTK